MRLPRDWQRRRKAALDRAGWRSERSGKAGALEVHHVVPMSMGGGHELSNLQVVTRAEHFEIHRAARLVPERYAWARLIHELENK